MSDPPPDDSDPLSREAAEPAGTSGEYRRWLEEAEAELVVIEVLGGDPRVPRRIVCFHAHLAAEKALKAAVVLRAVTLQRTHDLARLLQLLPPADAELFERADLIVLNPWSIAGRYPADLDDPGRDELGVIVEAARRTVAIARGLDGS